MASHFDPKGKVCSANAHFAAVQSKCGTQRKRNDIARPV